ncbi:MAG: hypothetical protein R3Y13_01985 [bacterium]
MKRIFKILLFTVFIFTVFINNIYAETYTCTYTGVQIDPDEFTGKYRSSVFESYNHYDYRQSGVTYNGPETISLTLTLNTVNETYSYSVSPNSSNSTYFVGLINTAINSTTDLLTGSKILYNVFNNNEQFVVHTDFKGGTGQCPTISSETSNFYANSKMSIKLLIAYESYFTRPDKTYTGVKTVIEEDGDETVQTELSGELIKNCGLIDLGLSSGPKNYYIVKGSSVIHYEFYGGYTLPLKDPYSHVCLSDDDVRYCPTQLANNYYYFSYAAVIYSEDSCSSYYRRNLDYMDSDYKNVSADIEYDYGENLDCSSLLGSPSSPKDTAYYIQMILDIMKYIGIVATLVLSVLDYVKAVSSSDCDAMKRANSSTVKRIIFLIILFIFPSVLKLLFSLTGIYTTDPLCSFQ